LFQRRDQGVDRGQFRPALRQFNVQDICTRFTAFLDRLKDEITGPTAMPGTTAFDAECKAACAKADALAEPLMMLHGTPELDPYVRLGRLYVTSLGYSTATGTRLKNTENKLVLQHVQALEYSASLRGERHEPPAIDDTPFDLSNKTPERNCELMTGTAMILFDLIELMRSRVVGKACSPAAPGEQFDILIGATH